MPAIDSSSLSKYVNKEINHELVGRELASEPCVSLELAISEVGNSIWKRVLRKEITKDKASIVFQEFARAIITDGLISLIQIDERLSNAAFKVALEEKITVYDGLFIELGHGNDRGLITSDEKQSEIFKKLYPKLNCLLIE